MAADTGLLLWQPPGEKPGYGLCWRQWTRCCFINLPLPGPSCGAAPRPRHHTSVEKELQDPGVQGWRPPAGIVVFAPSATHTQITTAETPKYRLERECGQGLEDRGPSS